MNVLEWADPTAGHLELTWSPGDEESTARARAEFDRLRAAGFSMYVVEEARTFDGVHSAGRVEVRAPETPASPVATAAASAVEPAPEEPTTAPRRRRGRRPGITTSEPTKTFRPEASRTIGVPQQRGG